MYKICIKINWPYHTMKLIADGKKKVYINHFNKCNYKTFSHYVIQSTLVTPNKSHNWGWNKQLQFLKYTARKVIKSWKVFYVFSNSDKFCILHRLGIFAVLLPIFFFLDQVMVFYFEYVNSRTLPVGDGDQ